MRKVMGFGVALVMACCSASAQAETSDNGVYVAARVGIAAISGTNIEYSDVGGTFGGTGATDTLKTSVGFASSTAFGGTIGYDFGRVRADIEVDYSRNRVKSLQVNSLNGTAVTTLSTADAQDVCDYVEVTNCQVSGNRVSFSGGSKVRQLSAMANLWIDLPIGRTLTPYIGGGVGVSGFEIEGEGKAKFAFQLGAGAAFRLSEAVSITADYRYRQTAGERFTDASAPRYALDVGKFKTSTFSLGLRLKF